MTSKKGNKAKDKREKEIGSQEKKTRGTELSGNVKAGRKFLNVPKCITPDPEATLQANKFLL